MLKEYKNINHIVAIIENTYKRNVLVIVNYNIYTNNLIFTTYTDYIW